MNSTNTTGVVRDRQAECGRAISWHSSVVGGAPDRMVGTGRNLNGLEVFENGMLVDCRMGDLARAMDWLMQNRPLRLRLGHEDRDCAASRFLPFRLADDPGEQYQS